MPYPAPSVSGAADLFTYANTVTSNLFGPSILFLVFITVFAITKASYHTGESFLSASFITAILSYFMNSLNLVPGAAVVVLTLMIGIGAFMVRRYGEF